MTCQGLLEGCSCTWGVKHLVRTLVFANASLGRPHIADRARGCDLLADAAMQRRTRGSRARVRARA